MLPKLLNGGTGVGYEWGQTHREVRLHIPAAGCRGKDFQVTFSPQRLVVSVRNPHQGGSAWVDVISGELQQPILSQDCEWVLEDGVLVITIAKDIRKNEAPSGGLERVGPSSEWWTGVLAGENTLDEKSANVDAYIDIDQVADGDRRQTMKDFLLGNGNGLDTVQALAKKAGTAHDSEADRAAREEWIAKNVGISGGEAESRPTTPPTGAAPSPPAASATEDAAVTTPTAAARAPEAAAAAPAPTPAASAPPAVAANDALQLLRSVGITAPSRLAAACPGEGELTMERLCAWLAQDADGLRGRLTQLGVKVGPRQRLLHALHCASAAAAAAARAAAAEATQAQAEAAAAAAAAAAKEAAAAARAAREEARAAAAAASKAVAAAVAGAEGEGEPSSPEPRAAAQAAQAAQAARLSLAELRAIQEECLAEDLALDLPTMRHWTAEEARAYFESGGAQRPGAPPPAAKPTPAAAQAAARPPPPPPPAPAGGARDSLEPPADPGRKWAGRDSLEPPADPSRKWAGRDSLEPPADPDRPSDEEILDRAGVRRLPAGAAGAAGWGAEAEAPLSEDERDAANIRRREAQRLFKEFAAEVPPEAVTEPGRMREIDLATGRFKDELGIATDEYDENNKPRHVTPVGADERRKIGGATHEVVDGVRALKPASIEKLGYSWDQSEAHVQIYVPLPGVAREDVRCDFESDGFACHVVSREGVPHQLTIKGLFGPIDTEASKVRLPKSRTQLIIRLVKEAGEHGPAVWGALRAPGEDAKNRVPEKWKELGISKVM